MSRERGRALPRAFSGDLMAILAAMTAAVAPDQAHVGHSLAVQA
jgi:hypothetical protein